MLGAPAPSEAYEADLVAIGTLTGDAVVDGDQVRFSGRLSDDLRVPLARFPVIVELTSGDTASGATADGPVLASTITDRSGQWAVTRALPDGGWLATIRAAGDPFVLVEPVTLELTVAAGAVAVRSTSSPEEPPPADVDATVRETGAARASRALAQIAAAVAAAVGLGAVVASMLRRRISAPPPPRGAGVEVSDGGTGRPGLHGVVLDSEEKGPVVGAVLRFGSRELRTDAQGRFSVEPSSESGAPRRVEVVADGYLTLSAEVPAQGDVFVWVKPVVAELRDIVRGVVGSRQAAGPGWWGHQTLSAVRTALLAQSPRLRRRAGAAPIAAEALRDYVDASDADPADTEAAVEALTALVDVAYFGGRGRTEETVALARTLAARATEGQG